MVIHGRNAKYYDRYVQDEAEDIFIDKYGQERGHKMWEGIIYKGNAMWTACDEILGELRTMQEINSDFINSHPEFDSNAKEIVWKEKYILQWSIWILIQIIEGKHFTNDFISTCIPTFKYFLDSKPELFKPLLEMAGIDPNNFQLSKKIQARLDAAAAEQLRIEQEEQAKRQAKLQAEAEQQKYIETFGKALGPFWSSFFERRFDDKYSHPVKNYLDVTKRPEDYVILPAPTNKDEQRIYDIISRATKSSTASLANFKSISDLNKAKSLAAEMNNKIKDENKRVARKQAALKYRINIFS